MIAVDFFCGAGGLTRGLLDAGIRVVLGVDVDKGCKETFEHNNTPAKFLSADMCSLTVTELKKHLPKHRRDDLLLAACAPCQPFAKHKKERGGNDQSRLLNEFGRFVRALRPGYVFIENVPGITKIDGFSTYRRFRKLLDDLSYDVAEGVLDAKCFGVPQTRRRYVILAVKKGKAQLPVPTHGPGLLEFRTVRNALKGYPRLKAGQVHKEVPNHSASQLSKLNLKRIQNCPKDGGDRRSWKQQLQLECHKDENVSHTDVYGRMWWNRPAPALTCKCVSLSNGRYGHPTQDRAISLREAAALQSFSDEYVFCGSSRVHLAQQIGNAVPVQLAKAAGKELLNLWKARELKSKRQIKTVQRLHRGHSVQRTPRYGRAV